ncbi:MFS transporter [Plantactinospora siamensis]|uniref:MFS transporter n=1 Tax=Plantactinospora siamensis TaxID=555372 RepID=A0ABV6P4N9_9ACTN
MTSIQPAELDARPRSRRDPAPDGARRLPPAAAFPLLAVALLGLFAAGSAPSPLFPIFQHQWGFAPGMLTVAFAVYALALLATLLVAGSLSDHLGRRPVLVAALLLQAVAMVMFLLADGVGWIVMARVVQGVATGAASGALTAAVTEAAPPAYRRFGTLVGGLAPLAGLAVGALATGFVVRFTGRPTEIVFAGLAAFFVLAAGIVLAVPETVRRRPGAWRSLSPRLSVPPRASREFATSLPIAIANWALGGLYLALVPTLVRSTFGVDSGLVSGFAIATLAGVGALASVALGGLHPRRTTVIGATAVGVGGVVLLGAVWSGSLALLFAGTAVAGVGFGAAFTGTLRLLAPLAEPHERAEFFAACFMVNYLAFGLPTIVAGQLIAPLGLRATVLGYVVVVIALELAGLVGQSALARSARTGAAPATTCGRPRALAVCPGE